MKERKRIALLVGQPEEDNQALFIKGFLEQSFLYDYDDILLDGHDIYNAKINKLQNALVEYYRIYKEHPENISDDELAALASYIFEDDDYEERVLATLKSYINRISRELDKRIDVIDDALARQSDNT